MNKYLILAAAAMTFAACSQNDEEGVDDGAPVAAIVSASIDNAPTRAIDAAWSDGDAIGVMVTSATSNMASLYKNVKYTVNSGGDKGTFTAASDPIFFQDANETVTFAAYYPYQKGEANSLPGTSGVITGGNTSTENASTTKQEKIDFLFASGATATKTSHTIEFSGENQFKHKMTRLVLKIKMGAGFTDSDISNISKITLDGLVHTGKFTIKNDNGMVTATAAADAATATTSDNNTTTTSAPWALRETATGATTTTDNVVKKSEDVTNENVTTTYYIYTMILYPQTLSEALSLEITADGQKYVNTTIQPALAEGTSYEYTITVNKTGLSVSGCSIGVWGTVTGGDVSAEMPNAN